MRINKGREKRVGKYTGSCPSGGEGVLARTSVLNFPGGGCGGGAGVHSPHSALFTPLGKGELCYTITDI